MQFDNFVISLAFLRRMYAWQNDSKLFGATIQKSRSFPGSNKSCSIRNDDVKLSLAYPASPSN